LLLVFCTVVIGAITVFFQYTAVKKGRLLAETQEELLHAKDRQLAQDLQAKDLEIGSLKVKSGELDNKSKELEGKNIQLKGDLENEEATARNEAARLEAKNLSTAQTLEEERRTRVEMEQALAPRILAITPKSPPIEGLKAFKGIAVTVESNSDAESRRAAGMLMSILNQAGWNVGPFVTRFLGLPEGVALEYRSHVGVPTAESTVNKSPDAALALEEYLRLNRWDVRRDPIPDILEERIKEGKAPPELTLPPNNAIRIKIGAKPDWYFFPQELRAVKESEQRFRDEAREQEKRMNEERRRFEEQFSKHSSPPK
jgi:hypothetical protein